VPPSGKVAVRSMTRLGADAKHLKSVADSGRVAVGSDRESESAAAGPEPEPEAGGPAWDRDRER
jgi:hypothetical protein